MARATVKVFSARVFKEGAGFLVRRTVGCPEMPTLDPFVLLDHFGPIVSEPGTAVGAPDHPHSGIEIVSYFLAGGTSHHDTLGNVLSTLRGQSMIMHAGNGLVHSELATDETHDNGGEMEGFQMWFSLPKAMRMGEPAFQKLKQEDMAITIDASCKVKVKVIVGKAIVDGIEFVSKAVPRWPITYMDLRLKNYATFSHQLEADFTTIIYCYRGSLYVSTDDQNECKLEFGDQAQVISAEPVKVRLRTDRNTKGRVLLLSGKPHGEEIYKRGGLVASSQDELEQIVKKAYTGGFGTIPGAEERRKKTESSLAKKKQIEEGSHSH